MRSAVAFAAFAVGALAVPHGHRHHQQRELKTDWDVVVKTDVVYVTAGAAVPTSSAAPVDTTADSTTSVAAKPTVTHAISEHQKWGGSNAKPPAPAASSSSAFESVVVVTVGGPSSSAAAPPPPAPTTATSSQEQAPQQPQSPPAQQQTSAPSMPSSAGSSYQDIVVYHHNIHRRNHSAPDIEWSDNLALSAQLISENCQFQHNTSVMNGGYGQNIAAGVDPQNISAIITDMFYNGEVGAFEGLYGQAQPSMDNFDAWGHFSQVVWKGTTQVGCYTNYCPSGLEFTGSDVESYFTVCNYGPEGNMANEYGDNIGSPLGMPTAQWNAGL